MAERRMFSKTIIDSDLFLDMPATAQLLYFHLSMRADDDGFINKPKSVMRMCGAKDDDINLLISKQFVIPFESGIVVIKHWKIHNYIRADRYKPTSCEEEKNMITCDSNSVYRLSTEQEANGIPLVDKMDTQDRIGKDSIGKDRLLLSADTDRRTAFDYQSVVDVFNTICISLPKVKNLSEGRKRNIKNASKKLDGDFESFFKKVESSDFLTGRNGVWNGCSFDWILKPSNLIKIIEGNYGNKSQNSGTTVPTLSEYMEDF